MARALPTSELRGELLGPSEAVLDGVWRSTASISARRAVARLKSLGRDDEVGQLQTALASIGDAQRMAGKLDQSANSRAGEASEMVADVARLRAFE